jgi:hypothetical protein
MADVPKNKLPPFQSPLERRPRYARAIGMITIEITNLEIILGELLSVLLHIPPDIGRAVYLTPRASGARLDILATARDHALVEDGKPHRTVTSIIKRARNIFTRRHVMVHNSWGLQNKRVRRLEVPWKPKDIGEPIKLGSINDLVRDIRALSTEVMTATSDLYQSWMALEKQRASPRKRRGRSLARVPR